MFCNIRIGYGITTLVVPPIELESDSAESNIRGIGHAAETKAEGVTIYPIINLMGFITF